MQAWNFKIFFALFTDSYKPFGLRRKPYLLTGWFFILVLLLLTGLLSSQLTATTWIVLMILVQFFLMLADVPADGYCVELGHLEPHDQRGQILATGQFIRFMGCVFAGAVQSFLLNGSSTNDREGCPVRWNSCWSWGLTMGEYYYLLFALVGLCVVPMLWFKEVEDRSPQRTLKEFAVDLFDTCRNLTTTYLLVFVVGNTMLALSPFNVTSNLQYLVIRIPNLLSGVDSMTTYLSLSLGIYIFQKHLINKNWRTVTALRCLPPCWACFGSCLFIM
jgi:MFS family permease